MAAPPGGLDLEIAFSRAFLLQLERGDLEKAALFARAFVEQHAEPVRLSRVTADGVRAGDQSQRRTGP